jgi:predicted Zn-dependent protease
VAVGLAYARLGRVQAAVEALARGASRAPGHPLVYQALGRIWLDAAGSTGDASALPKALDALERIADRPDATSETLTLYGRALLMSRQVRAAELVLQRAATQMPMDPEALRHLADAAQRLGHTAIANDARVRLAALTGS